MIVCEFKLVVDSNFTIICQCFKMLSLTTTVLAEETIYDIHVCRQIP